VVVRRLYAEVDDADVGEVGVVRGVGDRVEAAAPPAAKHGILMDGSIPPRGPITPWEEVWSRNGT